MAEREQLFEACSHALSLNLAVKKGESILIIADESRWHIGEVFRDAAGGFSETVDLLQIPELSFNGEEPPGSVARRMKHANVILISSGKSLSWTQARLEATENGARVASMPGITEEIILRTFKADYRIIRDRVNRLCDWLDETHRIRVESEQGTDLSMEVKGRKGRGRSGGIYSESGDWGNLPCGEAFIAPLEGTCSGTYIVDSAHAGLSKLDAPITISVERGRVVDIEGGREARMLDALLKSAGAPEAYNIAELGIGCNERASADSITLEAEKALGTCHIALGSNYLFGGAVKASIHLDGVLRAPTIYFDGEKVLEAGRLSIG